MGRAKFLKYSVLMIVFAMCAGAGRYGMLLWVRDKDYAKAARTLKAR